MTAVFARLSEEGRGHAYGGIEHRSDGPHHDCLLCRQDALSAALERAIVTLEYVGGAELIASELRGVLND